MSDATRSVVREREETLQHLAKLDAEVTDIKASLTAQKTSMEEQKALLFDIARRLTLRDTSTAPPPPLPQVDVDIEDHMSRAPAILDDLPTKRPPFGPNRAIKMDMPRFNGENPTSWLFHVDRFFSYYETSDQQRVTIASVYMDGPAIDWYQSQYQRGQISTWDKFQAALLARFGPSPFRDLRGEIAKVHQTTSVEEYYNRFVKLTNELPDIDPEWLQSYFESGLIPTIQHEVRARRPTSIEEALHFALLQEGRINTVSNTAFSLPHRPPEPQLSALLPPPSRTPTPPLPALLPPPSRPPTALPTHPPIIHLNHTQMNERKAQGLCFNCDEKYHRGHVCKAQAFMMIVTNEDYDEPGIATTGCDSKPMDYG